MISVEWIGIAGPSGRILASSSIHFDEIGLLIISMANNSKRLTRLQGPQRCIQVKWYNEYAIISIGGEAGLEQAEYCVLAQCPILKDSQIIEEEVVSKLVKSCVLKAFIEEEIDPHNPPRLSNWEKRLGFYDYWLLNALNSLKESEFYLWMDNIAQNGFIRVKRSGNCTFAIDVLDESF